MNTTEFVENCLRTESPAGPVLARWNEDPVKVYNLLKILQKFVDLSNELDKYKKGTFYNKPLDLPDYNPNLQMSIRPVDEDDVRLLHAILGISTEAGEMAEAMLKSLLNKVPLDKVNMAEELGDAHWYGGLASDTLKIGISEMFETVINKLKARYPDKFTDEKANNRDLDTERKILEDGFNK